MTNSTGIDDEASPMPGSEDMIDFLTCGSDLRRTLLTPIPTLASELSVRAFNVLTEMNILVVGDLAKTTALTLLRRINFGRKSLKQIKGALQARGLHLGTAIENWPDPDEVRRLLEERRAKGIDPEELPNSPHSCIEEELLAMVEFVVPNRHHKIFFARTGWNGGQVYTLEHLGMNPDFSGLERPVTRERIRQIEVAAFRRFRGRQFATPLLDRAMSCISEATPVAVIRVPEILRNAGLSKTGMDVSTIRLAAKTLHKVWGLESISVHGLEFLIWEDQHQEITILNRIVQRASEVDFLRVADLENLAAEDVENSNECIRSHVESDPRLEWLDIDEGIFWFTYLKSLPFKRNNKILFQCQKLFSVVDEMPMERLITALEKARTVKTLPSRKAIEAMFRSRDDFAVKGRLVCRAPGVKFYRLNKRDRTLLSVFGKYETILNFKFLSNALVRKGMSRGSANVLIVTSPWIYSISRGQWRCIARQDQIASALNEPEQSIEDFDKSDEETIVEFVITARHLTIGTHRTNNTEIDAGTWTVLDADSRELGTIRSSGQMLSGLKDVFSKTNADKGARIELFFDRDARSVIVTTD